MKDYETIRQKLMYRRDELEERLERVTQHLRHTQQPLDADFEEQATERENDEVLEVLDDTMRDELKQIDETLTRIENGNYGFCVNCNQQISFKRLEALPYTNICVTCANSKRVKFRKLRTSFIL